MFFIFLKNKSKFMSIVCYLLFDLFTCFLCIILDYKNSKFKYLIDNIVTNLWFSWNFAIMEDIRRKCNPNLNLSKFTSNEIILSGVVALVYN